MYKTKLVVTSVLIFFLFLGNATAVTPVGFLNLVEKVWFVGSKDFSTRLTGVEDRLFTVTLAFEKLVNYEKVTGFDVHGIKDKAKITFIRHCLERVLPDLFNNACLIKEVNKKNIKNNQEGVGYLIAMVDNPKQKGTCAGYQAVWFDFDESNGQARNFHAAVGFLMP